jgi:hypothetical protein
MWTPGTVTNTKMIAHVAAVPGLFQFRILYVGGLSPPNWYITENIE